jgi:dual specificity phosphatase 12
VCNDEIPAEVPASGIFHKRINIEDVEYADILIHLPAICQFIHHALTSGGTLLVHSVRGISRGAAAIVAYRKISSTFYI